MKLRGSIALAVACSWSALGSRFLFHQRFRGGWLSIAAASVSEVELGLKDGLL